MPFSIDAACSGVSGLVMSIPDASAAKNGRETGSIGRMERVMIGLFAFLGGGSGYLGGVVCRVGVGELERAFGFHLDDGGCLGPGEVVHVGRKGPRLGRIAG